MKEKDVGAYSQRKQRETKQGRVGGMDLQGEGMAWIHENCEDKKEPMREKTAKKKRKRTKEERKRKGKTTSHPSKSKLNPRPTFIDNLECPQKLCKFKVKNIYPSPEIPLFFPLRFKLKRK